MTTLTMQRHNLAPATTLEFSALHQVSVAPLEANETQEVLEFLSRRPIHTVAMVGFIRDNGLDSPLNRGRFYGCRNQQGRLEGVALIGHATLMETTTSRALEAFAEITGTCRNVHLMLGERDRIAEFWSFYPETGQQRRLACRELLYELSAPAAAGDSVTGLRLATVEDLDLVVPVQAQMAFEESGVNPLDTDAAGFRQRCRRRIELGRTWVLVDHDQLLFKAEVISETAEVSYLEGVWVNPETRGQGLGFQCMAQVGQALLARSRSLCLLVNENNSGAQLFYEKAGYQFRGVYETIFLESAPDVDHEM